MNRFIQQSYSTPSRRRTRFEPTERFSERKRSLFPTLNKENEQDSDSDIGHMSPLDVSSSPDRYDSPFSSPHISDIFRKEIHEPFSNRQNFNELFDNITPIKQKEEPEKILAPNTPSPVDSPDKGVTNLIIPETPTKGSPTKELKTPQETSSTNLQLPKLVRKSLVDLTNTDKSTLKRKPDSPDESPCNKSLKLDNSTKIPKARTALFPDIILPAKSFYPKSIENYKPSKYVFSEPIYKSKKAQRKSHTMYLCHRKKINKSNCGQINAGVRHGIKKPKHKTKMSRSQIYNVAKDLLDNSPLNEFLDKVNKGENTSNENVPSSAQLNSMDSIIRNIDLDIYKAQPLTSVISPIQTPQKERNSLKRPSSPAPEQNRKFFKSSKPQATVTINKNIKLKIDNGEMHLVEKKKRKHHFHELTFDTSDLNCDGENIIHKNIGDIMKSLDDEDVETQHENTNNIVLTAYSSIAASDNSIQLHNIPVTISETHIRTSENLQVSGSINNVRNELNNLTQHNPPIKKVTEMLLSPTSLMCDMTSGLALNSPKNDIVHGQISVNYELKKCLSFSDDMAAKDKLFPIFYNPTQPKIVKKQTQPVQHSRKSKPTDYDQMIIDAGQKRYGHTRCKECDLVYIIDDPYDEAMHHNYHHSINVLRFDGWKNEKVVSVFPDARIILVQPGDTKKWWHKVEQLIDVVNRELGFVNVELDHNHCQVYIYIKNKKIQGCVVIEPKTEAHKMIKFSEVDCCSEESYPVKCGVSRIWVAQPYRKKGVASLLMNSVRCNYIFGHILSNEEISFSSPTDAGKAFASKYMKTDEFLVYMS